MSSTSRESICFKMRSDSSPEKYYTIYVKTRISGVTIACTCKGAEKMMLCKHRIAVIENDASWLFDKSELGLLQVASDIVQHSRFSELMKDISIKDQEIKMEQKNLKAKKKEIARLMVEGSR